MTDQPRSNASRPRKGRWVVGLILLSMIGVWRLWPRSDARFIGKWASHTNGNSASDSFVTLRSDGSGRTDYLVGSVGPVEYEWSVADGRLLMGTRSPSKRRLLRFFTPLYKLMGVTLYEDVWTMKIHDVQENTIELSPPSPYPPVTLRRLPE